MNIALCDGPYSIDVNGGMTCHGNVTTAAYVQPTGVADVTPEAAATAFGAGFSMAFSVWLVGYIGRKVVSAIK